MKRFQIILSVVLILVLFVWFVWFVPLGEGSWMDENAPAPVLQFLYVLAFVVTAPLSRELGIDAPSLGGESWRPQGATTRQVN